VDEQPQVAQPPQVPAQVGAGAGVEELPRLLAANHGDGEGIGRGRPPPTRLLALPEILNFVRHVVTLRAQETRPADGESTEAERLACGMVGRAGGQNLTVEIHRSAAGGE